MNFVSKKFEGNFVCPGYHLHAIHVLANSNENSHRILDTVRVWNVEPDKAKRDSAPVLPHILSCHIQDSKARKKNHRKRDEEFKEIAVEWVDHELSIYYISC
jgi:hypothetical protein